MPSPRPPLFGLSLRVKSSPVGRVLPLVRFPKMPSCRKAVEQLLERALTSLSLAGQSAPSLGT